MKARKKRILHIEDDPALSSVVKLVLAKQGYEVFDCASGTRGMELVYQVLPHVVLLDLKMPVMDGFKVLEAMESYSALRERPIICLTAMTNRASIERAFALGADGYIFKPMNVPTLCGLIEYLTRSNVEHKEAAGLLSRQPFKDAAALIGGDLDTLLKLDIVNGLANAGEGGGLSLERLARTVEAREDEVSLALEGLEASGAVECSGGLYVTGREAERDGRLSGWLQVARDPELRVAFINLVCTGALED